MMQRVARPVLYWRSPISPHTVILQRSRNALYTQWWAHKFQSQLRTSIPCQACLFSTGRDSGKSRYGYTSPILKQMAIALAAFAGIGAFAIYNYDTSYLVAASLQRCSVAAKATFQVAWDYYQNFPPLPPEDDPAVSPEEREKIIEQRSAVHLRAADNVKKALMKNGGVYIKLGQHISAMQYVLPIEWCSTMQSLQDRNTASTMEEVSQVLFDDTGVSVDELFSYFDPTPIGVASLAQVHRAILKSTGEEVAVKIQHPNVRKYSDIDIATVSVMFEFIHSIFPDFQFMWLSKEMNDSLPRELDFRNDKINAEQVTWNFSHRPDIPLVVPKMIQANERVLVMEYINGKRCDDLSYLHKYNINPADVSRELGKVFAEMTFSQGFLHCDPHPGNVFVRPCNKSSTTCGYNFELVLLDHGLYRRLTPQFRYEYSEMWHALMRGDKVGIQYWSKRLSGTDLYKLFSIILTGQNWNTIEEKSLTSTTGQANFSMDTLLDSNPNLIQQITEVLASVPPVLLLVLKTNDLLRMVDQKLFADQPKAVQDHARLKSWLRLSHYSLMNICSMRSLNIRQRKGRKGVIGYLSQITRLFSNWLHFKALNTMLSIYGALLSIEDVFIRWRAYFSQFNSAA